MTVAFTNTSAGDPVASLWDFGDGLTSTLESPTHTYAAGIYTVTLTVRGVCGHDTMAKTAYVKVDYSIYLPIIFKNYRP